ncbi:MAG: CDP-alcohol phosphatidyltransferase family protein [Phycisphaerae bacterium]|nr:CDP-alcohol phosphatidyltransferase family protein [Phycisphaerae bacterium]
MKLVSNVDAADRRKRRRDRVLKSVAVLPSLATLGNLVCGLGAIYCCMLSAQADGTDLAIRAETARFASLMPTFLAMAAYLLVAAMFFDSIDGRLARFTRKTSEFGGQLDSLADIVSFGVAPAVLVLCIVRPSDVAALAGWQRVYWRAEWVMAAVFVCCAALRLARFNVENEEDESAHMGFRGLPSPGAAAALIGLVIFHQDLLPDLSRDRILSKTIAAFMPPFAMALGLLMVSRFRYVHLVNVVLRGRRSFRQVVAIVILVLVGLVVQFQLTIAVAAAAYALSGPVGGVARRIRRRQGVDADTVSTTPDTFGETVTYAESADETTDGKADGDNDNEASARSAG